MTEILEINTHEVILNGTDYDKFNIEGLELLFTTLNENNDNPNRKRLLKLIDTLKRIEESGVLPFNRFIRIINYINEKIKYYNNIKTNTHTSHLTYCSLKINDDNTITVKITFYNKQLIFRYSLEDETILKIYDLLIYDIYTEYLKVAKDYKSFTQYSLTLTHLLKNNDGNIVDIDSIENIFIEKDKNAYTVLEQLKTFTQNIIKAVLKLLKQLHIIKKLTKSNNISTIKEEIEQIQKTAYNIYASQDTAYPYTFDMPQVQPLSVPQSRPSSAPSVPQSRPSSAPLMSQSRQRERRTTTIKEKVISDAANKILSYIRPTRPSQTPLSNGPLRTIPQSVELVQSLSNGPSRTIPLPSGPRPIIPRPLQPRPPPSAFQTPSSSTRPSSARPIPPPPPPRQSLLAFERPPSSTRPSSARPIPPPPPNRTGGSKQKKLIKKLKNRHKKV